jgi:hypothetical protein
MKKIISLVVAILLIASVGWAGSAGKSIGNTADALITSGGGYLKSIVVHTDGANAVTVAVYDNTSAAVPKLISDIVVTTSAANRTATLSFLPFECLYFTGMYFDITTGGTVAYDVFFESF